VFCGRIEVEACFIHTVNFMNSSHFVKREKSGLAFWLIGSRKRMKNHPKFAKIRNVA